MAPPLKHHRPVPAGALDVNKIHHMFYEAALWRVQAWNSHVVSADAFVHEWHTTFFFGLIHGLAGPIAGPTVERLVRNWGRTETVETADSVKLQALANSFTKQLCAQFWHIMHTQGPQAAQAYANGEEALRCQARNQVLAMIQGAHNHDMALAREAEDTRKSLIVVLAACEMVDAIVGFFIVTPAAAALAGVTMAAGIEVATALWVVPAVGLAVSETENFVTGPPPNWKLVATTFTTAASKRTWGYYAFPLEKRLKATLEQRTEAVNRISRGNLNDAQARFKWSWNLRKTAEGLSDISKAKAQLAADQKGLNVLSRNLRLLKAGNTGLPVVFAASAIVQDAITLAKRWNQ